jgi:hypothetical protein
MEASIESNAVANEVTITIQGLNWNACHQASFYAGEVQVRDVLQVIGQALTRELLQAKDVAHWSQLKNYPRLLGRCCESRDDVCVGV